MNKKNIVSFIAGMAVMGVIGVGINGVTSEMRIRKRRILILWRILSAEVTISK